MKKSEWEKLDRAQDKERKRSIEESEELIDSLLRSPDGFERLLAIDDEEWEEAVAADELGDETTGEQ